MKDCSESVYPEVIAALHEWGIDPDSHRITIQQTGYLDLLREQSAHRAQDSDASEASSSGTAQATHPPHDSPSQTAAGVGEDSGDLPEGDEPTDHARDDDTADTPSNRRASIGGSADGSPQANPISLPAEADPVHRQDRPPAGGGETHEEHAAVTSGLAPQPDLYRDIYDDVFPNDSDSGGESTQDGQNPRPYPTRLQRAGNDLNEVAREVQSSGRSEAYGSDEGRDRSEDEGGHAGSVDHGGSSDSGVEAESNGEDDE